MIERLDELWHDNSVVQSGPFETWPWTLAVLRLDSTLDLGVSSWVGMARAAGATDIVLSLAR